MLPVEAGVLYTTLVLLTGSIWAKPIWGTWRSWDARLTTTLVFWLLYVAYLMVRSYAGDAGRGARYAAVVGIAGFVDFAAFAVTWLGIFLSLWMLAHRLQQPRRRLFPW